MSQSIRLQKKSILVTGGARGLGKAFASSLAEVGAQVAIADILVEEVTLPLSPWVLNFLSWM